MSIISLNVCTAEKMVFIDSTGEKERDHAAALLLDHSPTPKIMQRDELSSNAFSTRLIFAPMNLNSFS
jgi:hypothetical protein